MDFLDLVKIGSPVRINVDLSKDRLSAKTLQAIGSCSTCIVKDFRLTDGKGIGVVVELSNGENEWFFENEIEILDNEGNIIKREPKIDKNFSLISNFIDNFKYTPKNNPKELLNPLNYQV